MSPTKSTPTTIESLVAKFADTILELKAAATKEATLRVQYLDPFFKLLGWDVANDAGVSLEQQDVIIEPSIDVAERDRLRARRPDYLFRIAGQAQLTCEAKKPAVDLDRDKDAIFQAKRDAYSLGLPFAILTDFEQFRVYDTGYQPDFDSPRHGLVPDFSLGFADYPAQWDVIHATFGRDAVAGGSLDRLRARVRRTRAGQRIRGIDRQLFELRGDLPAGNAFLAQLENQRHHVAADLYANNRAKFSDVDTPRGAARLAEYTQRLIDRVVFMRISEDRNVVNYGILRDLVDESEGQDRPLRDLLVRQFRQFDRDFNGYLFKPHDVETCDCSPAMLRDLIAQFYPPESRTNFAVLPDDLLATVYERFLGSTIAVHRGRIEIEQKPEVRHAGGVYYTPKFVVDSILRRVLAPKLAGKAPLDLIDHKLTILDPACGSGSFLIAAYDMLVRHCERAITDDPRLAKAPIPGSREKQPIAFQQAVVLAISDTGRATRVEKIWRLTPDFKGRLLTDCVFGVDIDQQAVEVTIMSLYSKVLNDLPSDWRGISEQRILPPLDNNIRCGNSLIDQDRLDAYAEERHGSLFSGDDNVRFRINAFDWHSETRGFGRVLGRGDENGKGFGCIIGNPPYIRVQELKQWAPEECEFYKWQYRSARRGNYDIYVAFTERVLTGGRQSRGLLGSTGTMGFIMPHKWWQAEYGVGLRELVAEGKFLKGVLDFGDQQVFSGATTYTAIQTFDRLGPSAHIDFALVRQLADGATTCEAIDAGRTPKGVVKFKASRPTNGEPWAFKDDETAKWASVVSNGHPTLGEIAEIFVGVQTSADKVYHLDLISRSGSRITCQSRLDGSTNVFDRRLCHPLASGTDVQGFYLNRSRQVIVFPYEWRMTSEVRLLDREKLSGMHGVWNYLERHEATLRQRERGRFNNDEWWQFGRSQNLGRQASPKLCIPRLAERLRCAFDEIGDICLDNVDVNGVRLKHNRREDSQRVTHLYLCGLLNSSLADSFIKATVSTTFRGGYSSFNRQFIENLPIKVPITDLERKLAERIESAARQAIDARRKLASDAASGDRDRRDLEADIEAAGRRIDDAVMNLYGVNRLFYSSGRGEGTYGV